MQSIEFASTFFSAQRGYSNLPGLRRYDPAKRDSHRVVAMVQATPFDGPVSVGLNFVRYFDDYDDDSDFGFLMSLGAWIEHYDIDDDPTSGTRIYMPAAFFLVPNDADYEGNVAFVRTRYRW